MDAVQAELDELKTVRYWVHKVIPDALPSHTESGATSLRNTMEESQNQNELHELLDRTAKQAISPQQEEIHRAAHHQSQHNSSNHIYVERTFLRWRLANTVKVLPP